MPLRIPTCVAAGTFAGALAAAACARVPDGPPLVGAVVAETTPTPAGSRFPHLAADAAGRLYLTWLEPAAAPGAADTAWRVRFAVRDPGATRRAAAWSAPRTVAAGPDLLANWADFPSVVPLGDDGRRLAAQWPVLDPRGDFAYFPRVATSADGGATWTPPVVPVRSTAKAEYDFAVPFRAAGDSVGVVWLDGRAGGEDYALRFTTLAPAGAAGGTPAVALGAERVVEASTCSCCRNAVAYTARGLVLAYRDRAEGELRNIAVRRYALGPTPGAAGDAGRWSAPTVVHDDGWRIAGCPTNGAAVAARGDTVAVAWYTAPAGRPRVHVARSADGGATFGPPVRVDGGAPEGRVGVALVPGGDAVVSWIERRGAADRAAGGAGAGTGAGATLQLRRVSARGVAGPPRTAAALGAGRASGHPQLVAAGDAAFLAWTAPPGAGAGPGVRVARVALAPP